MGTVELVMNVQDEALNGTGKMVSPLQQDEDSKLEKACLRKTESSEKSRTDNNESATTIIDCNEGVKEDHKSHTFRKRRLTNINRKTSPQLTSQNSTGNYDMVAAAAKVAAEFDVDDEDDGIGPNNQGQNKFEESGTADADDADDVQEKEEKEEEQKRGEKRKFKEQPSGDNDVASIGDVGKRKRRDPTSPERPQKLKVVHAGIPPPPVARRLSLIDPTKERLRLRRQLSRNNQITQFFHDDHQQEPQTPSDTPPAWMKTAYAFDESRLPFPSTVVGTYSCHGLEPIFNDEQHHLRDDDDEEDDDEESSFNLASEDDEDVDEEDNYRSHQTSNIQDKINTTSNNDLQPHDNNALSKTLSEPFKPPPPKRQPLPKPRLPPTTAKINQDRGGIAFPYGNNSRSALFAAYDGHGEKGELVSQFALHEIQKRLQTHPKFDTDIETAFRQTFVEVDKALVNEPKVEPLYSGSTACVVLLRDNTLYISNVGDSRAVLARRRRQGESDQTFDLVTVDLSVDQNPDSPGEQDRIERCGGYVSPPPEVGLSARVWLDSECTQIGLAMSRSIGDHAVKGVGVIAEPVVSRHDITDDDEFIILATDGVWEFLSSAEAVSLVAGHLNAGEGSSKACQSLIVTAARKWQENEGDYRDDITALVVRLKDLFPN